MSHKSDQETRTGVIAAVLAYLMWGLMPLYFKIIDQVPPVEVLAHRILWSVAFGALILFFRRQWSQVAFHVKNYRTMLVLFVASCLIAGNWFIYIWAVQKDQIFQASLGYYINPLMYVAVGVVFFKEPFRGLQQLAVAIAAIAILILSLIGGKFPLLAVCLAATFTAYGTIKKQVAIGGMPGLFLETAFLLIPALFFVAYLQNTGQLVFNFKTVDTGLLVMLAGPFTVLPLLFFSVAAHRLKLSDIGFLQFIGPTLQFIVGVFYGEELTPSLLICFVLIWIAVVVYAIDAWREGHKKQVANRAAL